jgi:hypothetical protein
MAGTIGADKEPDRSTSVCEKFFCRLIDAILYQLPSGEELKRIPWAKGAFVEWSALAPQFQGLKVYGSEDLPTAPHEPNKCDK